MTVIEVVLVLALGSHGLTTDKEALDVFAGAQKIFREQVGIELRLKKYVKRKNPFPKFQTLARQEALLRRWQGYFKRRRNRAVLKLAITPPLADTSGLWYLAGFASGTCAYRHSNPVGYSVGELENPYGAPRFKHSIYAMTHEIGHLLGAPHVWVREGLPQTIMHPSALAYLDKQGGELFFAELSVQRILACVD